MGKHWLLLPVLLAFLAGASPAHAWTWPASGPVLQHFSYNGDPYAAGQHRGVDVGGSAGEPVLAPAAGSVTFAGTVPGGGRTITIRTPDGLAVTLLHLGTIAEVKGASVAEGAQVGTLGSSGTSEWAEPYVHLGIRQASDEAGYLDPESFLPPRASAPATTADATDAEPMPSEAPAAEQVEPSGHAAPQTQTPVTEPAAGQSPAGTHAPAPGTASLPSNASGLHAAEHGAREPSAARTAKTNVRTRTGSSRSLPSPRPTSTRSVEWLRLASAARRRETSIADPTPAAARAPQVRGSRAVAGLMAALLASLVASGGLAVCRFDRGRREAAPACDPSPTVPDFVPSWWLDGGCVSRGRAVGVPVRTPRGWHRSHAPSRTCERRASSLRHRAEPGGRGRRADDRSRRGARLDLEEARGVR
jgi:hypothetical protein